MSPEKNEKSAAPAMEQSPINQSTSTTLNPHNQQSSLKDMDTKEKNFCHECGRRLTPDTKFCEGCGAPMSWVSDTVSNPQNAIPPSWTNVPGVKHQQEPPPVGSNPSTSAQPAAPESPTATSCPSPKTSIWNRKLGNPLKSIKSREDALYVVTWVFHVCWIYAALGLWMGLVEDPSFLIQIPIYAICGIFIRRNKSRVAAGALLAFAILGMVMVLLMQGPISGMVEKGISILLFFRAVQATSKLHGS